MKKILMVTVLLLAMSSLVMASPLMDYSQGKGSIDLTMRNTENSVEDIAFEKKYNLDGSLTFGLGNNLAFQYRYFQPKSKSMSGVFGDVEVAGDLKLKTNEFNVLYKIDKNLAAMAGVVKVKGTLNATYGDESGSISTSNKNLWQVGLVGNTEIAPKVNLYGVISAGSDLTNWQAGISYEFAPNFEFNIDYRDLQVKKVGYDVDLEAKGLGFGVTYKY